MKYKCYDYEKELRREMKMRRKVWKLIPGTEKFLDPEHQRRYDILEEILKIFENIDLKTFLQIQDQADSLGNLKDYGNQSSLFL